MTLPALGQAHPNGHKPLADLPSTRGNVSSEAEANGDDTARRRLEFRVDVTTLPGAGSNFESRSNGRRVR
jgi:hypothetical protein